MNTLYLSLLAIQDGLQLKGWIVTISGFMIVVIALIILFLIFAGISKLINLDWNKLINKNKDKKQDKVEVKEVKNINPDNDDVMVAIGLALSLSMDSVHDVESDILTIKRVERHTSPWNARIYGMNNVK
ncbi:MAG: OadG family protein [Bacteroidales bacterium]|nr:OadG family protein [Bacteroidales bacterium]MBO5854097.1 OadG family protein [Bacteroidales bacterium]MBR4156003.1 OadG family protein [Bacteroidales bacterium]